MWPRAVVSSIFLALCSITSFSFARMCFLVPVPRSPVILLLVRATLSRAHHALATAEIKGHSFALLILTVFIPAPSFLV